MEYYTEEEVRLEREVSRLTELSLHSPLGIAFVTLDYVNSSKVDVLSNYRTNPNNFSAGSLR